jgi:hypothetical protein
MEIAASHEPQAASQFTGRWRMFPQTRLTSRLPAHSVLWAGPKDSVNKGRSDGVASGIIIVNGGDW